MSCVRRGEQKLPTKASTVAFARTPSRCRHKPAGCQAFTTKWSWRTASRVFPLPLGQRKGDPMPQDERNRIIPPARPVATCPKCGSRETQYVGVQYVSAQVYCRCDECDHVWVCGPGRLPSRDEPNSN